jgi:signal transduction histidine kinase
MSTSLPQTGSLRLRFMLAIGLWVGIGILGIWFTATQVFYRHIEASYHEELEVHVHELARLSELDPDGNLHLIRPLSDPRYEVPLSGFYWQASVKGQPILKSESMTRGVLDQRVAHSPDVAHVVEDGPTGPAITYGMIKEGPSGAAIHIVIATDQRELDEDIASFTKELTVWLISLGALLLATGLAIIIFGLRPLNRLGEAIARLQSGKAQRLEGHYPTEIAPLVNDLNAYIDQTSQLVERGRVQAGNLAHSLRTPLAVMTDEAERMAETENCSQHAQVLLEQADRMQQQIDFQLARTKLVAAAKLPGARSALPDIVRPIIKAMERLYPQVSFHLDWEGNPAEVQVDSVVLMELLSILLDNAGKWASSSVTLTCDRPNADKIDVIIRDDGPGMTQEEIAKAFEIGTRFAPEKPGSGLGLAMARDIAESIDALIELKECSPSGLEARIRMLAV